MSSVWSNLANYESIRVKGMQGYIEISNKSVFTKYFNLPHLTRANVDSQKEWLNRVVEKTVLHSGDK